jgi:hypothetical protein
MKGRLRKGSLFFLRASIRRARRDFFPCAMAVEPACVSYLIRAAPPSDPPSLPMLDGIASTQSSSCVSPPHLVNKLSIAAVGTPRPLKVNLMRTCRM